MMSVSNVVVTKNVIFKLQHRLYNVLQICLTVVKLAWLQLLVGGKGIVGPLLAPKPVCKCRKFFVHL